MVDTKALSVAGQEFQGLLAAVQASYGDPPQLSLIQLQEAQAQLVVPLLTASSSMADALVAAIADLDARLTALGG